jgi:uncharacterized protein (TIGR02246 family)
MLFGMEIIVDIARSPQGQLTGTARPARSSVKRRDFHGVMELLGCLERIIDVHAFRLTHATTTRGDPTMTDPFDFPSLPQADQDAITTTLLSLSSGFQARDVNQLTDVYSVDADWVNAFGTVKRGGAQILGYLRGLFADENFNAGILEAPPEVAIRVLTPEVVLVSVHLRVAGQKLAGGGEIPERDNRSLRVLHRRPDGTWPIVSEMYNDANREASYLPST